jgi:hypothetical protein
MNGQVILSAAYGINVLPQNDPYVAESEKMVQAFAFGSTQEAALLDAIPWCICCRLIRSPKLMNDRQ